MKRLIGDKTHYLNIFLTWDKWLRCPFNIKARPGSQVLLASLSASLPQGVTHIPNLLALYAEFSSPGLPFPEWFFPI